jgi:hypothetical protein
MTSTYTIYGIVNSAAFNQNPSGDSTWFASRAARDAALADLRARMIGRGLSPSAARSGIYPVENSAHRERGVWIKDLEIQLDTVADFIAAREAASRAS